MRHLAIGLIVLVVGVVPAGADQQAAVIRVGQSTITANRVGWQATNGAQVVSYSNNNVSGNKTDGAVTSTVALQ